MEDQLTDPTQTAVPPLQDVVDQAVLGGLRWLAAGVAAILVVFVGFNVTSLGARAVQIETAADAAVLTLLAALLVALQRRVVPPRWANGLVLAVGCAVLINILISSFVGQHPETLAYVPYVVIGAGSFLLSTRVLLIGAAAIVAGVLPAGYLLYSTDGFVDFLVTILAGFVLSFAIHAARMRYQRQMYTLRLQDEERAAKLAQSHRLEAIGQLAGGVAHDMNNVLGVIMSTASLMRAESPPDDPRLEEIDAILEASRRGSSLTRDLLGFARRGRMTVKRVHLQRIVAQVVKLLERTIPKGISIETRFVEELAEVEGDAAQLSQLVMNLCLNAADALHGQGRLTLGLDNLPPAPAAPEQVCLTVQDNGVGMRPEVAERAFEPFFTTKPAGKGTGLGLAMAFGTVKSHGGEVALKSGEGEGTTVTVRLPALPATAEAARRRRATTGVLALSDRAAPTGGHVLVVDDEPLIRSSLRRILTRLGYEVTTAENGAEAVAIYQELKDELCLVMLDMAMPVMDGAECFRRLRQLDPRVKVLVASGYSAAQNATEVMTAADGFLRKPFETDELEAVVHALVEGRAVNSGRG